MTPRKAGETYVLELAENHHQGSRAGQAANLDGSERNPGRVSSMHTASVPKLTPPVCSYRVYKAHHNLAPTRLTIERDGEATVLHGLSEGQAPRADCRSREEIPATRVDRDSAKSSVPGRLTSWLIPPHNGVE